MEPVLERKYSRSAVANHHSIKRNGTPAPVLWNVDEYYRMYDAGLFRGRRVQLIHGEIIEMAPMLSPHATSIQLVLNEMEKIFQTGFVVRPQLPMSFSPIDEPEPDVAVVTGAVRDYAEIHPSTALLIVEVADSSLRFDRKDKAHLYAENKIAEYWIINLKDRCLEVHRNPIEEGNHNFSYKELFVVRENETIAPLAKPKSKIKVADILP